MTCQHESELQRLLDENEIRSRVARFARYLDERRWHDYATLYAEDAVLELPHGRAEGRDTIEKWVEADLGRYAATHHAGGLQDIRIDGDHAEVLATLLATHVTSPDGRTYWTGGGWYDLHFSRHPEGWLITSTRPRPTWLHVEGGAIGAPPQSPDA